MPSIRLAPDALVRFAMSAMRLRREELAIIVGVKGKTVAAWHEGTQRPSRQHLERIVSLIGKAVV